MKQRTRYTAAVTPMALVALAVASTSVAAPGDQYAYDSQGDKDFVNNTNVLERYLPTGASNNRSYKVTSPRAVAEATFTDTEVAVDGVRETVWDAAQTYPIANKFAANMSGDNPGASAQGTLSLLWDGPVLYALVEVSGDSTQSDSTTPNWSSATFTPNSDGLFINLDVYNDQWGMETDTQGVFFMGANPALTAVTSFSNAGIPSLGSFFNAANQDYSPRLKAFKASGYAPGDGVNYTYELALQIEGSGDEWSRELENGTELGFEVGIYDQGNSFTYWSKTDYFAGREGNSNLPNSERVRNRDWGVVTLAGKEVGDGSAYSGWRADELIRFWNSANNPGGTGNGTDPSADGDGSNVWTPESKARMVAAKAAYLAIKDDSDATDVQRLAAVVEVGEAFSGLRWADTRYPDPRDLPSLHTLPNAFEFFDPSSGTDGMVTNDAEWQDRKAEILELAQFYEYGYKPQLGVDYTINLVSNTYAGSGNASVVAQVVPTNANYSGGNPVNVTINVTMPASVPEGQKAAVGFGTSFTSNGIASVPFPNWAGDVRSDPYVWGSNRSEQVFGTFRFPVTFYTLFPYERNSTSGDTSILMANATGVSVYLDALEMAVAENPALAAKIDPTRAVTKGFSIGGKNAFVAAVFDERVKAVVTGGAGATGPANWRYNAQGQEYDFTGTDYYNPGAEAIVAHGTEGPGNSYRHNRVRETELFRHFMDYGHMYSHEDGSYGYGNYSRLPFDQALLVSTLAPDRAIVINTNLNDYNDGAVTDNMSLQIAASVYENFGVDSADFVKFNSGNYVSSGDPHGSAPAAVEGKFLSDFLYGTETLTTAEASRISTDPYSLAVTDGQTQSPYDYYWGGYNGITGGNAGVAGVDGWYFFGFDKEFANLRALVEGLGLSTSETNSLAAKLDQVIRLLSQGRPEQASSTLRHDVVDKVLLYADSGKVSVSSAAQVNSASAQVELAIASIDGLRPAWTGAVQFDSGDEVVYQGSLYRALWWTKNDRPGNATGPWQEIATTEDGTAIWTPSRVFQGGEVAVFDGRTWEAQWYTRNQQPGDPYGPWQEIVATPEGGVAMWAATTVYEYGDLASYGGQTYMAKWWTRNQVPGSPYGPWAPVT